MVALSLNNVLSVYPKLVSPSCKGSSRCTNHTFKSIKEDMFCHILLKVGIIIKSLFYTRGTTKDARICNFTNTSKRYAFSATFVTKINACK